MKMSVNCHNSGKICWNLLYESLSYKTIKCPGGLPGHNDIKYIWFVDIKKAEHFSKVMANVIKEFSETYKEEIKDELNPTKWEDGDIMHSGYSQVCYSDSLIENYLRLNLILLNSNLNKTPLLTYNALYDECSGHSALHPDDYLVDKFIELRENLFVRCGESSHNFDKIIKERHESWHDYFDNKNYRHRIELTKEVVEEVREYLKEVFICLISFYRSEPHRHLVEEREISYIVRKSLAF